MAHLGLKNSLWKGLNTQIGYLDNESKDWRTWSGDRPLWTSNFEYVLLDMGPEIRLDVMKVVTVQEVHSLTNG